MTWIHKSITDTSVKYTYWSERIIEVKLNIGKGNYHFLTLRPRKRNSWRKRKRYPVTAREYSAMSAVSVQRDFWTVQHSVTFPTYLLSDRQNSYRRHEIIGYACCKKQFVWAFCSVSNFVCTVNRRSDPAFAPVSILTCAAISWTAFRCFVSDDVARKVSLECLELGRPRVAI